MNQEKYSMRPPLSNPTRFRRLVMIGVFIAFYASPWFMAQPAGPKIWQCGLQPGDPPVELQTLANAPATLADVALWQEGRPIVLVKSGQPLPRQLPEGQVATISVTNSEGKPAAGILIQWKPAGLPNLPEPFGRVRTDGRGVAEIHLEQGAATLIWVEQEGYLPMVTTLSAGTAKAQLPLIRERGRVVRVRDAYGRNLAGAELRVFPLKAMSDPLHLMANMKSIQRRAVGDEVGRVSIPLGFEHTAGAVIAPGCSLKDMPALDQAGTVVLKGARQILISIRDKQAKTPITNANVACTFSSSSIPVLVFSQEASWANGSGMIIPGAYPCKLTAKAKGRVPVEITLDGPPAGGRLDVFMEKGVLLAGTVVNTQGQSIQGASVCFGQGFGSIFTETTKDGTFELPPLPAADAPYTLMAGAEGYLDKTFGGIPARDNLALRVVLNRGATVSGRVLDDETSQPAHNCKMTFQFDGARSSQGVTFEAKVAGDGSFLQSGLDPGTYYVRVHGEEGSAPPITVMVAGTEPHDLGDIFLSGHPTVKGVLALPDGQELSSAPSVRLERYVNFKEVVAEINARSLEGKVSNDGSFAIRGAAAGRYRLVASDGEWKKVISPVAVDKNDVDVGKVLLEKSSSIRGHLVSLDGGSVSSWRIILATQAFDFDPPTSFTEDDGSFQFNDMPAGVYRLQAFSPLKLMPEADQRVGLSPGQDAEVTVPVGGVSVTAFLQVDGRPAGGATVSLSGQSDAVFESGVVAVNSEWGRVFLGLPSIPHISQADATGLVTVSGVSPGPNQATMRFNDMDYRMPVTISASPQPPLTWNFQGMELLGRVLNPDGSPAARAMVAVGYQGVGANPQNSVVTDENGNFRISGLGEGTLIIGCRDEGGLTGTTTVTLISGGVTGPIVIQMRQS